MALHLGILVIVQPSAPHVLVFHGKTQRLNEVQGAACVGRKANHIARVGRNFRFNQNNLKHGAIVLALSGCSGKHQGRNMHGARLL